MKPNWSRIKSLISRTPPRAALYLSLIDEDGVIECANATMLHGLELDNPRHAKTNFFDLLHPRHVESFRKIVEGVTAQRSAKAMEVYVKNGYYHPMKWEVNYLQQTTDLRKIFFCIGYKIMDDDRLKKFNGLVEKHYPLIIEGLTGIIFHDNRGDVIAANQETARLFDTTLERLYELKDISDLWRSGWEIRNEEGDPVLFEDTPFMKALQTGKPHKAILKITLKSGEHRWLHFNSQTLPADHPGNEPFIVSNIIDVTNEKILAERVEENNALINSFVKQTPNLAWVIDEDGKLMLGSHAFFQYLSIDEKSSINRNMADIVPPFIYKALYEKHLKVFATGLPLKLIERVKLADGSDYISHINIYPIEGIAGKRMVGGYAINLPDTNRIEAELRDTNDRLLTLTRAASNAIWEWDMQTGQIYRNELLMDMIGYHHDDAKGLSWWLRRIHPDDRNRVSDKVKEASETNQHSWQDEYRFKCADGNYKHIQDKGFIIYENGLPVKMIGSLHDISELRELENKLADERIQRQKDISETIIRVQEKERTRIGHELHDNVNQILSTTLLFVDMMNAENKEQRNIKDKSLEYLRLAIEEIRKVSKELVVPQLKEQGLADSIQVLIDDIHLAHKIRIKFAHDLDTDLLSSGKKITLFRIVQEQIKNILTHSKATTAEILLYAKNSNVYLVVKDNGVGFDSTKTHRGIGLSNIYERVSFYNGNVDIQTAGGKGCQVTVTISLL